MVVLPQGRPYDIRSYVDVAPLLAAEGYRVIVPLPGQDIPATDVTGPIAQGGARSAAAGHAGPPPHLPRRPAAPPHTRAAACRRSATVRPRPRTPPPGGRSHPQVVADRRADLRGTRARVSDLQTFHPLDERRGEGVGDEGTVSVCSFWYVEALTRTGRLDEARLASEEMLTYADRLGLYAEEIGHTSEQLDSFPQAFTHLALINAAFDLGRALG